MRARAWGGLLAAVWFTNTSCGSTDPTLPAGVICTAIDSSASNSAALTEALARASSGSCVVPAAGTYRGAFVVATGISLVAPVGAAVNFEGDREDAPALTVKAGAGLFGVNVVSAPGVGVQVESGPAQVAKVTVSGAGNAALLASCAAGGCLGEAQIISLREVNLSNSRFGLWVDGVHAKVAGGRSAGNSTTLPTGGQGVIATGDTLLEIDGMTIEGNQKQGVLVYGTSSTEARLSNLQVLSNKVGLWVRGGHAVVTGGRIAKQSSSSLSGGQGAIASDGALLEMDGLTVEENQTQGVLIDGASGTEARLDNLQVLKNNDRGIWAQGVLGSTATPKLHIQACSVVGNRIGGIGARESRGIIIIQGRVADTVSEKVRTDLGEQEDVGDGLGLFENTGEVHIEGLELANNQRSQMLVDKGANAIIIIQGLVSAGASQLGMVVQRTTEQVQSDSTLTVQSAGQELPVNAPHVGIPAQ